MTDLAGKTCIITGATSGIGLAIAERLSGTGARLVLVGRDRVKGEAALAHLRARAPSAAFDIVYADLATLTGMRGLAASLAAAAPKIDILINNAGAIFRRRGETEDKLEQTFALNHMAYYVVTRLVIDRIVAAQPARIINVASTAHRTATLDFDDLQMTRRYDGWTAYRRSKLCNILFTRELARRLEGSGVTANSLHPGFVASRFGDNNTGVFRLALGLAKRVAAISTAAGAETPAYLAAAPEVASVTGRYFDNCRITAPAPAAEDDAAAHRLWHESARLAGLPHDGAIGA